MKAGALLGRFSNLASLFFLVLLMTGSACLTLFIEKLLFARFSLEAMNAAVAVAYAVRIFQGPCVALVLMAQVYVGWLYGANRLNEIGPAVWQFIWFSLLSPLLLIPISYLYAHFYFHGMEMEKSCSYYFHLSMWISFLLPLGTTLSCYYLGQGRGLLVLVATLGAQALKLLSASILVFGFGSIPSFGLLGGILSTIVSQGLFCLVLFFFFIREDARFCTHVFHFRLPLFIDCMRIGFLRALNRVFAFSSWAMISRLMVLRGGESILLISVGETLFIFLPFLAEALCQSQVTAVSQLLGSKHYSLLSAVFRYGLFLVLSISALVAIPLVLFPTATFHWLFPAIILPASTIQSMFLGCWLCFTFFAFHFIPLSYVLAFKDMFFLLFMGAFNWVNGYLLMYFFLVLLHIPSTQFWLMLTFMHVTTCLLYLARMRYLLKKTMIYPT